MNRMSNKTSLCFACAHEDDCNMHKRNPLVKVVDCQRYEMDDTYREISNAIHGTAKMFKREKDSEQE